MAPLSIVRIYALVVLSLALAGCGFHLRGSGGENRFAQKLYIEGPAAGTPFVGVFTTYLTGAGGSIVRTPVECSAIVHLYKTLYQRQPITLSRTGRATGFDLIYRIVYDVRSPKGEIIQSSKEFEVKREYFNDQTLPLAQLSEEWLIRDELEKEAAQLLLRQVVYQIKHASDVALPPEKKS